MNTAVNDRIAALEAEVAELRKDADRYKWLRKMSLGNFDDFMEAMPPAAEEPETAEEFDAAVDAARGERT